MTDITTKFRLAVPAAIKRAYALGQLYWQQADSESYRENAKSDTTRAKFGELLSEAEANAKEAADEIDRLSAEVASLRRALWWLHSVTGADIFHVGDEDRDIHEEAMEIAFDRGADDTTPDDYIAALVVLSDESAALTEAR